VRNIGDLLKSFSRSGRFS